MSERTRNPLLVVVAGPSGSGKTTLFDRLLADDPDLVYSVSCTTRDPRGSEADGEDYFFVSEEEFERRVAAGLFLEHAVVHGSRYGTLRSTVEESLGERQSVLMDIDVQGAGRVREHVATLPPDNALRRGHVDVFIAPPSLAALEERLVGRAEDGAEAISRRLENARGEMARQREFRYTVVNRELEAAYRDLTRIVELEAESV